MQKQFVVTSDLYATTGQRFLNYLIDLVVIYALIFIIFMAVALIAVLTDLPGLLYWLGNIGDFDAYLILFSVFIPYYTLTEGFFSRSIAKFITKTKVVMKDGSKPGYLAALKRTLCRFIPFEFFSFLGSSRGWHDSIPDTYVVNAREFELQKKQFYEFEAIGQEENQ